MQYHTETETSLPVTIVVPDDISQELLSCVASKLSSLGYKEVVNAERPEISPFEYLTVSYEPVEDNGVQKYREVYTKVNSSVSFDPWKVVENLTACAKKDDPVPVYDTMATLFDDPSFFAWFVSNPSYTRGETNSEKLVAAFGDRSLVEEAIGG